MKNNIKQFFFALVLISSQMLLAYGQNEVIGKVVDSDGQEAIGATIVVKGTSTGTVADMDGNYRISVPDVQNSILVFSYVGMKTAEIPVNGQRIVNVKFEPTSVELDEYVAIGYANVKRKDLTGAVSSVRGDDINKVPVTSVSQALAGKIAGVNISQSDGGPDATISVRVRGGLSITQSNEPLYIIDGFPSEDGMSGLDPSDIASIDVLKDASATAIYGSRGGNGVILITTKGGYDGKPTVNYDMYVGIKKLTNKMDLLSSAEFVKLEYERAMIGNEAEKRSFVSRYGLNNWSADLNTQENMQNSYAIIGDHYADRDGIDWQGLIFDDALPFTQNHKFSISGGNKMTKYIGSYAYSNDGGIMMKSGFVRHNIRFRLDQRLSDKARFVFNVNHNDETTTGMGSLKETSYFSRMQHIVQYRPIYGYNEADDQKLITEQVDDIVDDSGNQMQNPIVSIENEIQKKKNKMTIFNGEFSYNILKNLTYKGTIGYRDRTYTQDMFYDSKSRSAINSGGAYGTRNIQDYNILTYNNVLTYKPKLGKSHSMNVLVGQEDYIQKYNYMLVKSSNFPEDNFGLDDMGLGATPDLTQTNVTKERLFSFFGRLNYDFKQRYLFTFTLRADGSSKFGDNNKWGYFPSASFAWRISDEEFMGNATDYLSNLKLRLSYGTSGNNRISTYRSLYKGSSSWMTFNNTLYPSYYSVQLKNPNLKWETNISANIGLDIGLFQQRIQLVVDAYENRTKDLLLEAEIPLTSGYATNMMNVGKTRNRGIEFSLTTINIDKRHFQWETNFNISTNRNKVIQLYNTDEILKRSGWAGTAEFNDVDFITKVGQAVGNMYGYKWIGLYTVDDFNYDSNTNQYVLKEGIPYDPNNYPKPGYNKFQNTNDEDNIIDEKDKQVIGNMVPAFSGGLTNTFRYKNFDLSFAFTFSIGNEVYNANRMYFTKTNNKYRNSLAETAQRFTYIDETGANVFNDPEKLAEINRGNSWASIEGSQNLKFHSRFVEDGSYLRLSNITFGYSFPKDMMKKIHVSNLRIYASAYNLFVITKYTGFDPDVNARPNGGLTPGVDWGAYPRSMSAVIGLNLSF